MQLTMGLVQVDEVKNIMVDNIEKVLERGERIELLVDKSENLRDRVSLTAHCLFIVLNSPELSLATILGWLQ